MENEQTPDYTQNSIKLTKNTKGYNWEIKINAKPGENNEEILKQINELNVELSKQYGQEESKEIKE